MNHCYKINFEDFNNCEHLLLNYIIHIDDVNIIKKIFDKQLSDINAYHCLNAYNGILDKDVSTITELFNYGINSPVFKLKPIIKYLKYNSTTTCNYSLIRLLDKINRIDFYLEQVEKDDYMKNMGLMLYYYINKKTTQETLDLIEQYIVRNILNKRKTTTIRNEQIRLFNLISEMISAQKIIYVNGSYQRIMIFLKNYIFFKLTNSQLINLLKKMNDYHYCDGFKELLISVKDNLTPTQFLDIKKIIYKENISEYVDILKNKDKNYSFIYSGLEKLHSKTLIKEYFDKLNEQKIITHKNSTDIFKQIIGNEYFISYEKESKDELFFIYDIFIKNGLDIDEMDRYFKSKNIYFTDFERLFTFRSQRLNNNKTKVLEITLDELRFIKRKKLLDKLKLKLTILEKD